MFPDRRASASVCPGDAVRGKDSLGRRLLRPAMLAAPLVAAACLIAGCNVTGTSASGQAADTGGSSVTSVNPSTAPGPANPGSPPSGPATAPPTPTPAPTGKGPAGSGMGAGQTPRHATGVSPGTLPMLSTAAPSPSAPAPSPTKATVKPAPSPTKATVKPAPSPTKTTAKPAPSPTKTTAKPSPTKTTAKPSPTKTTAKPSPTKTAASKVPAAASAPANKPVYGFDVSNYQGDVNWAKARSEGALFVFIKATEGSDYINPYFAQQYNGSYKEGIIRGAYAFAHPNQSSGQTQAKYFVEHGGRWSGDGMTLPGALDIENNPDGSECYGLSTSAMRTWISDFLGEYHSLTGVWPVIYSTASWWDYCTDDYTAPAKHDPFWLASWASSPGALPAGYSTFTFWQFTDEGGILGVDEDVFNGAPSRLMVLAKNG